MSRPTTRLRSAIVAIATALVLGACGDTTAATKDAAPSGEAGTSAFPVTVKHKFGSTEITAKPTRVVTLGYTDGDTALALGVKPIGAVEWFEEQPYGDWPWSKTLWGTPGPEIVGKRDEYNLEKIAALKPDLIIAQYSGMKKEQYDTLTKIADVVAQPEGFEDFQAPWREMTRAIGKSLGQSAKSEELIKGVEDKFAAARAAHPEFAGRTAAIAETYEAGKFSIFSANDPKLMFLKDLGFTIAPKYVEAVGKENVLDLSFERVDVLEADRLIWFQDGTPVKDELAKNELYSKLNVAKENRHRFFDYRTPPLAGAMSFNTVLSIPWAIDQVSQELAKK